MDTNLEEQIKLLREQTEKNKNSIIAQEHRIISVWRNLFKFIRRGNKEERSAAIEAFLSMLIPGKITIVVTAGALIGILTILLMYKNNELVAEQNFYLQEQIYKQAVSDRAVQLAQIKEYLYKSIPESEKELRAWRASENKNEDEPSLKPFYNEHIRSEALAQYINIIVDPLKKPEKVQQESLWQLGQRLSCKHFSFYCAEKGSKVDNKQEHDRQELHLTGAHLNYTYLNDDSKSKLEKVRLWASGSNFNNANLSLAHLRGADLRGDNLIFANLFGAARLPACVAQPTHGAGNVSRDPPIAACAAASRYQPSA